MMKVLSIIGTQEIILLLTILAYIGIPVLLIDWFIKSINKMNSSLDQIAKSNTAYEIEKLFALKEKGIISQQEFDECSVPHVRDKHDFQANSFPFVKTF